MFPLAFGAESRTKRSSLEDKNNKCQAKTHTRTQKEENLNAAHRLLKENRIRKMSSNDHNNMIIHLFAGG